MASTSPRRVQNTTTDITSPPITVIVGSDTSKKTFYVHRALLVSHSQYFEAACKDEWKEGSERAVDLPEDSPAAFEVFVQFAYHGYIPTAKSAATMSNVENDDEGCGKNMINQEMALLRDCWLLGDKLIAMHFKDAVIDALIDFMTKTSWFMVSMYQTVYPRTAGPCTLRRLLVDVAVYRWQKKTLKEQPMERQWMEVFRDVAVRMKEVGEVLEGSAGPYYDAKCHEYHEHGDKPCYKTLFG